MQEIFYEESVSMRDERPAKVKYTVFTVCAIISVLMSLFGLLLMWIFMFTPVEKDQVVTGKMLLFGLLPGIIMLVIGGVSAGLLFFRRHYFYVSYDYTFVSGELRICKVYHNRKRKLLYRLSPDKYVKVGKYGSDTYNSLKRSPDLKEDVLTPNSTPGEDKEFYYIQAATNVGKKLLILECREEMLANILHFTRMNILESDFRRK